MASSQSQQPTAQSPFKLFSRVSWSKGSKKAKQGNLGEENNMYYHPELKRWVEKGKEEEAEREAAGPPPPPVLSSGSITSAPTHKRSLSQRYVLQPNLSVSSSLASLGNSFSQTDLVGLMNGAGGDGSFSGPPSALGSTAPSPPQSSNCLASFASGPPSTSGISAPMSPSAFFIPVPPQRSPSQPLGSFFVPPPPTPEDEAAEAGSTGEAASLAGSRQVSLQHEQAGGDEDASAAQPHPPAPPPAHHEQPLPHSNGNAHTNQDAVIAEADAAAADHRLDTLTALAGPQPPSEQLEAAAGAPAAPGGTGGGSNPGRVFGMARPPLAVTVDGEAAAAGGGGQVPLASDGNAADASPEAFPGARSSCGYSLSLADGSEQRQLESPGALASPISAMVGLVEAGVGPVQMRPRRLGSSSGPVGVSDGGAAISLHEGMGVLPVLVSQSPLGQGQGDGWEGPDGGAEQPPTPAQPDAEDGAVEPVAEVDPGNGGVVEADSSAPAPAAEGDASTSSQYSQYYYQQYAYLYQYALSQGYGETDAVAYAQYYAAAYAQQYEAQAPQGDLGSEGNGAGGQIQQSESEAAQGVSAGAWQEVAEGVEDEAAAVVQGGGAVAQTEVAAQGEEPIYFAPVAQPDLSVAEGPLPSPPVAAVVEAREVLEGPVEIAAAPLPADLTAAAAAATQHQQCAVTAAVAAAAANVAAVAATGTASAGGSVAPASATSSSGGLAPAATGPAGQQLLMGLGAAGAKRLTQFSSAATAAVASLGATVAATAPVAAALSVAATAAAAAGVRLDAASSGGGLGGLVSGGGLSEDDFERIMHPGDPAKLDGPLPWELPDHLRTGRRFLALCSNWQLTNPGTAYSPHLLLQAEETGAEAAVAAQPQQQSDGAPAVVVAAAGAGDVALAAEGGSGSAGGAAPGAVEASQQQPAVVAAEPLSSYERACRLAQFGEPAAGLVPTAHAAQHQKPSSASAAVAAPVPLDISSLPGPSDSSGHQAGEEPTPRSDDPFAGAEHIPLALQRLQTPSPLGSPAAKVPNGLSSLEEPSEDDEEAEPEPQPQALSAPHVKHEAEGVTRGVAEDGVAQEAVGEVQAEVGVAAVNVPAAVLAPLGSVEAASFFDNLGDQAIAEEPASAVMPPPAPLAAVEEEPAVPAAASAVAVELAQPAEVVVPELLSAPANEATATAVDQQQQEVEHEAESAAIIPAPAAAAAAAAIDSVVQALEQLRSSAAATALVEGDGGGQPDSTLLLQQIHSSLAQATQALAGMGVDVSALAALAGATQDGQVVDMHPVEWTPSAGSKRPRVDGSPATPTRPVISAAAAADVVTPLLAPGPPVMRGVTEVVEPEAGDRFQQLGRRLSNASQDVGVETAAAPQPVVVSLTLAAAPVVDVAAVEERVRCEERAAFEARLEAAVDSEREAAALVIASVEQQRDGLQQRVEELEQQLEAALAERAALTERLAAVEAGGEQALAAVRADAAAEREQLSSHLAGVVAERDQLATEVATERAEKAGLAAALSSSRAEAEELRRQYAERFSSLTRELEETRGSLNELQAEHDELLLCLGQESTKVAVLTDALRETGGDPDPLIQRIEAEYETMGLGAEEGGEQAEGEPEAEGQGEEAGPGGDGWEGAESELII